MKLQTHIITSIFCSIFPFTLSAASTADEHIKAMTKQEYQHQAKQAVAFVSAGVAASALVQPFIKPEHVCENCFSKVSIRNLLYGAAVGSGALFFKHFSDARTIANRIDTESRPECATKNASTSSDMNGNKVEYPNLQPSAPSADATVMYEESRIPSELKLQLDAAHYGMALSGVAATASLCGALLMTYKTN